MLIAQQETAIEAFHSHVATGKAGQQQHRILSFISSRGGDWSIGEIASELMLEKSTVSAHIYANDLVRLLE